MRVSTSALFVAVFTASAAALINTPVSAGRRQPPLADRAASTKWPSLRVSPASPLSSASFTARWRADRERLRGRSYGVELRSAASPDSLCTTSRTLRIKRAWNTGDTLTFRMRADDMTLGGSSLWCPGKATLRVFSRRAGSSARTTHAALRLAIRSDPANPVIATRVEIELLEGSSMTVSVPDRPDRSSPLTGQVMGFLGGANPRGTDAVIDLTGGGLTVEDLRRDPLCTPSDRAYPDRIALATTGSRADQFGDQRFTMTLRFDEEPIWLTGCQGPAGPPSGRVLAVAGRNVAGATGSRIEATGSIAGVELSGGAVAQLAFALVLSVDLSAP